MSNKLLDLCEPYHCTCEVETELNYHAGLHRGLNTMRYVKTVAPCMSCIHYFLHSWLPRRNPEMRGNRTSSQLSKWLSSWGHQRTKLQVQLCIHWSSFTAWLTRLLHSTSCPYCFILQAMQNPFISVSSFMVGWEWDSATERVSQAVGSTARGGKRNPVLSLTLRRAL